MVASNARKNFGFLHISFYKVVQIVLPIIIQFEILVIAKLQREPFRKKSNSFDKLSKINYYPK